MRITNLYTYQNSVIGSLKVDDLQAKHLAASTSEVDSLVAGRLVASSASIDDLRTKHLVATKAEIDHAIIRNSTIIDSTEVEELNVGGDIRASGTVKIKTDPDDQGDTPYLTIGPDDDSFTFSVSKDGSIDGTSLTVGEASITSDGSINGVSITTGEASITSDGSIDGTSLTVGEASITSDGSINGTSLTVGEASITSDGSINGVALNTEALIILADEQAITVINSNTSLPSMSVTGDGRISIITPQASNEDPTPYITVGRLEGNDFASSASISDDGSIILNPTGEGDAINVNNLIKIGKDGSINGVSITTGEASFNTLDVGETSFTVSNDGLVAMNALSIISDNNTMASISSDGEFQGSSITIGDESNFIVSDSGLTTIKSEDDKALSILDDSGDTVAAISSDGEFQGSSLSVAGSSDAITVIRTDTDPPTVTMNITSDGKLDIVTPSIASTDNPTPYITVRQSSDPSASIRDDGSIVLNTVPSSSLDAINVNDRIKIGKDGSIRMDPPSTSDPIFSVYGDNTSTPNALIRRNGNIQGRTIVASQLLSNGTNTLNGDTTISGETTIRNTLRVLENLSGPRIDAIVVNGYAAAIYSDGQIKGSSIAIGHLIPNMEVNADGLITIHTGNAVAGKAIAVMRGTSPNEEEVVTISGGGSAVISVSDKFVVSDSGLTTINSTDGTALSINSVASISSTGAISGKSLTLTDLSSNDGRFPKLGTGGAVTSSLYAGSMLCNYQLNIPIPISSHNSPTVLQLSVTNDANGIYTRFNDNSLCSLNDGSYILQPGYHRFSVTTRIAVISDDVNSARQFSIVVGATPSDISNVPSNVSEWCGFDSYTSVTDPSISGVYRGMFVSNTFVFMVTCDTSTSVKLGVMFGATHSEAFTDIDAGVRFAHNQIGQNSVEPLWKVTNNNNSNPTVIQIDSWYGSSTTSSYTISY